MLDEEEGAEIADPVAEQKMVKNVLESLLRDEAPEKPQVTYHSCSCHMHQSPL